MCRCKTLRWVIRRLEDARRELADVQGTIEATLDYARSDYDAKEKRSRASRKRKSKPAR